MNVPALPWLQRRFVPAAVVAVAIALALSYLAVSLDRGGTAQSVFGWAAALAPPIFIGVVAGLGRPKTPVRSALALIGIALLLVAPLFGEAYFCILMVSPIYLGLTPLIAVITRKLFVRAPAAAKVAALLLPWVAFAADRPVPVSELPLVTVSDAVVLPAPPEAVWAAIDRLEMDFPRPEAAFARWGLPVPRMLHGHGAGVGAERRLVFHNGTLVGRVIQSSAPRRFALTLACEDPGAEFFDHWVALEDTAFDLEPLPGGGTRLVHTTHYRPLVRPRPWFTAVERYGSHLLQGYLLRSFVPRVKALAGPPVALR
jgi:hypothetical protein